MKICKRSEKYTATLNIAVVHSFRILKDYIAKHHINKMHDLRPDIYTQNLPNRVKILTSTKHQITVKKIILDHGKDKGERDEAVNSIIESDLSKFRKVYGMLFKVYQFQLLYFEVYQFQSEYFEVYQCCGLQIRPVEEQLKQRVIGERYSISRKKEVIRKKY